MSNAISGTYGTPIDQTQHLWDENRRLRRALRDLVDVIETPSGQSWQDRMDDALFTANKELSWSR